MNEMAMLQQLPCAGALGACRSSYFDLVVGMRNEHGREPIATCCPNSFVVKCCRKPEERSPMKTVCVLLLAGALAGCKSAPTTSAPVPSLTPTAAASPNNPPRPKGGTVEGSDEQNIARVEQKRAHLQPSEQLVLIYQDVYPQWNTYIVTLTPQNEAETLKKIAADSVKLAERKPTRQAAIVFRSPTDEPAVWSYIKKRVAEAAGN
jgi:hypothetical protein